jgi:lysophospholipase L1-like esterase
MKPSLALTEIMALLLLGSLCRGQSFDYISRRLIDTQEKIAEAPSSIIIVGDSLTEEAPWPNTICGFPVINGGAGGGRTAHMLPLVVEFRRLQYHPAAIVIATGMNDSHKTLWHDQSYEAIFRLTYRAIVQAALNATPNVLLATVTPVVFEAPVGSLIEPAGRDNVNREIREVAAELHLTTIDTDGLASIGPEPLTRDGVHFTPKGMQQFIDVVVDTVKSSLRCS